MTLRVVVEARGHGQATAAEQDILDAWRHELFAEDREVLDAFSWEDKRRLGVDLRTYRDDELAGFAHVFVRLARRDGEPRMIGCLGSVMTAKACQGQGIGRHTVELAAEIILDNLRADFGVLLCVPGLLPFYAALGWRRVECPVWIEQPSGRIEWPHEAMILTREPSDSMPRELDLCGPPF